MQMFEADIKALATIDGRQVGTAGHLRARGYITARLSDVGLDTYAGDEFAIPYSSGGSQFTNIVGRMHRRSSGRPLEGVLEECQDAASW